MVHPAYLPKLTSLTFTPCNGNDRECPEQEVPGSSVEYANTFTFLYQRSGKETVKVRLHHPNFKKLVCKERRLDIP
jgi:hypothetical protein